MAYMRVGGDDDSHRQGYEAACGADHARVLEVNSFKSADIRALHFCLQGKMTFGDPVQDSCVARGCVWC